MTGISGSGKTTFSKQFAKENNLRYINIDAFYYAVFGDKTTHTHRDEVWELCFRALDIALKDNVNVILDTNCPRLRNRNEMYDRFGKYFDEAYLIYVRTEDEQCIKNNQNRERVIPNDEIRQMLKNYERPTREELERWNDIFYVYNENNNFKEMISLKNIVGDDYDTKQ